MATITKKTTTDFSWAAFDRSALRVGDEISEVLKNGEEVIFVVMDEGVIGLKNCLREEHRMNNDWTNKGGWEATEMRRYLNEDVFAVLPDVKTVGVMGDHRTYDHLIAIRAVTTDNFMTADWARIPYDVLARISNRITNEVDHVNRVVYDITSKPPGTVEWE